MFSTERPRKRVSFSPSPSPSTSIGSNTSNRLSREEIEQILTSPYDTGYTYSQSAAYIRSGSAEFRHPQLCRSYRGSSPSPSFLASHTSFDGDDVYAAVGGKRNRGGCSPQCLIYFLKKAVSFPIAFILFLLKIVLKALWIPISWLLYGFLLGTVVGPVLTAWTYYKRVKYGSAVAVTLYSLAVALFSPVRDFLAWLYEGVLRGHSPPSPHREFSVQSRADRPKKLTTLAKSFFSWLIWGLSLGNINTSQLASRRPQPIYHKSFGDYAKAAGLGAYSWTAALLSWALWTLSFGQFRLGGTRQRTPEPPSSAKTYGVGVRTRAQAGSALPPHDALNDDTLEDEWTAAKEGARKRSSLCAALFAPFRWIGAWAWWLVGGGFLASSSASLASSSGPPSSAKTYGFGVRTRAEAGSALPPHDALNDDTLADEWTAAKEGARKRSSLCAALFAPFRWIGAWAWWLVGGGFLASSSASLASSSGILFSTPKFTSTPTAAAAANETTKKLAAEKRFLRDAAQFAPSGERWRRAGRTFGFLLLWLPLLLLLLYLLYNFASTTTKTNNSHYVSGDLFTLQSQINELRADLRDALADFESYRAHVAASSSSKKTPNEDDEAKISLALIRRLETQLDAKVGVLLDEMMGTERKALRDELQSTEAKILDRARREIDELDASVRADLQRSATAAVVEESARATNASLERLRAELNEERAIFASRMSAAEKEQYSRLLAELKAYQDTVIGQSNSRDETNSLERHAAVGVEDATYLATVRQLIKEHIQRYDADKTGLADYALESSGGSIASIRCTVPYSERSRTQKIFGIPLWFSSYSPRSVIQRKGYGTSAGECWAFVGAHGYLTIKLSSRIDVSAVSYEHLPVQLSPDGHIQTAPRDFLVYSYQDVDDLDSRFLLGNFTYDDKADALQIFQVEQSDPKGTPVIELETLSNHGAMITCLYRFRVHGHMRPDTTGHD